MKNRFLFLSLFSILLYSVNSYTQVEFNQIINGQFQTKTEGIKANNNRTNTNGLGMNVAWYSPNQTPGIVGQYEKLELGVKFDSLINVRINEKRADRLNPYNPEDIDLYAEFWYLIANKWYGPVKINAFHYVDYERGNKRWNEIETKHNFRIRHAPRIVGQYKCNITAIIAGVDTITTADFKFKCIASTNKGFVNVGENKRYLKQGNSPYYPVGHNLTGPNTPRLTIEWQNKPASPDLYDNFYGLMTELSENGANYFRYIVSPWQSEIEYEHLGNYRSRMSNAWEFDRILDTAKTLDLKMHYNMAMHYSFEAPSGFAMTNWDWSAKGDSLSPISPKDSPCWNKSDKGYCYRNELDLVNPVEFLTDSTAMVFYKRRIRYMIARWGYSTTIGIMELLSEANNFGSTFIIKYGEENGLYGCRSVADTLNLTTSPYRDSPEQFIPDLMAWQIEMCRYIKEDLGHNQHPLSINYTGSPDFEHGDRTYYSEYVDIASYNSYYLAAEKSEKTYKRVENYFHNPDNSETYLDKPIMNSEYGTGTATWKCDGNAGFIQRVCLTPFTGTTTSALTWDSHLNEFEVWKHLGPVRQIMEGIPLDQENWTAQRPMIQKNKSVEVFQLRKEELGENTKIVGAISNRTFNYWTQAKESYCTSDQIMKPKEAYLKAIDYSFEDLNKNQLKIKKLGIRNKFKIKWYNALTGELIEITEQTSNSFGKLILKFPGKLTGSADSPILFFKLYPANQKFIEN